MGSGTTAAAIVAETLQEEQRAALPLKSTVLISLRSVHKIMRVIDQVLWLFNCWTFRVSFVVCTDSFVGSTWASDSDLGRSWRPSGCIPPCIMMQDFLHLGESAGH